MSWKRGGGGADGGVSRRWAVLLCVGSFCLGLLFTNRMWTLPEASEIARPNEKVQAGNMPLAAECDSKKFAGSAWEALRHIRQAVDFLVISLKPMRTLREVRTDVCPALSIQQLERIVSIYWDDVNGTNTISAEFTSSLKTAAREESNTVTTFSILLDDDSSIPFSLDDITKTLPAIGVADDDLLPFVHENPNFAFLLQRGE